MKAPPKPALLSINVNKYKLPVFYFKRQVYKKLGN